MDKKWQRRFRPLNLFYIAFTAFMCISSLTLYLYSDARRIQAEKTSDLLIQTSNTMSEISLNCKMVMDTYALHFVDTELNEALQNIETYESPDYVENVQYVLKAIHYMVYGNHLISDVGFVRSNGQLLASTTLSDVDREMVKEEIARYPDRASFQISDVYDNRSIIYERKRVLLTREIYKMEDRTKVGHMVYFIDFPALLEIMEKTESSLDDHLGMIVANNHQIIYNQKENQNSELIATQVLENAESLDEIAETTILVHGKSYTLHMERDSVSNWIFASYYRKDAFLQESLEKNKWFILFMSGFCILVVFIEIKSFRFLNDTVSHLNEAMATMETGKFVQLDKRFEKNRELKDVVTGFNQMSSSLKNMIRENYVEQIKRKEAELKMLHFQINPHFLYNTLNLISSLAVLDGNDKIVSITSSMSELFRYSMQGDYVVQVEDEINIIKRYFSIQELRFPKKFQVEYDLDEKILDCHIGKFTLQPLVENIFKHNALKNHLEIQVTLKAIDNETFTISIRDSGSGIESKHLKELNEQLSAADPDMETSIGIFNVNSRLKKRAGDIYGLKLYSEFGQWTEAVLMLPIRS